MHKLFNLSFFVAILLSATVFVANTENDSKEQVKVTSLVENIEQAIAGAGAVILYLYAPGCVFCHKMAPIFEELKYEMGDDYIFIKLDLGELNAEERRAIVSKYAIRHVPTFLFIYNNVVKGRVAGYVDKDAFKAKIKEVFA